MGLFRKIRDRLKKGVRDVGSGAGDVLGNVASGAGDIFRNSPEALMILAGLTMTGAFPGGKPFGLPSFLGGTSSGVQTGKNFSIDKLIKNKLLGLGKEKTGGGIQDLLGNLMGGDKILPFIMAIMAKRQFEADKEGPLSKEDRLSEIDLIYDSIVGGPQKPGDRFRGLHFDPVTDTSYDVKDYATNKYSDFEVDSEGNIIDDSTRTLFGNEGGIVGLQAGGNPFWNRNRMSGSLGGGMNPAGRSPDPTVKSITGYRGGGIPYIDPNRGTMGGGMPGGKDPTVESIMGYNPRYITRANGGMTAGDLADRLEDNPGISQFFPRRFGAIHGPGGPKEDKIPAMLSDGEFVMTAKAVDNAGGPKSMYNLMNRLDPDSSKGRGIV